MVVGKQGERLHIEVLRLCQLAAFAGLEVHPKSLVGSGAIAGKQQEPTMARERSIVMGGQMAGEGRVGEAVDVELGSRILIPFPFGRKTPALFELGPECG